MIQLDHSARPDRCQTDRFMPPFFDWISIMNTASTFVPAFEGDWIYQSFLVLPTDEESAANPGAEVTARKWAKGEISLADDGGSGASGELILVPGVPLNILVSSTPGADGQAAAFTATGTAETGPIKGAVYHLSGWAIPNPSGKLDRVSGALILVRGPDQDPTKGPSGVPVGTVGSFSLERKPS